MNEQTKFCIKCGTPYTVGTNFCANCGEKLSTYTETPNNVLDEQPTIPSYEESENKRPIGTILFIGIVAVIVLILIIVAFNIKEKTDSTYNGTYETSYYNSDITYPEQEEELSYGTVSEDGVYKNEFFGIKLVLPGWTYLDEQGLEYSKEAINSFIEDKDLAIDDDSDITIQAVHPNGITNMNIIIGKNDDKGYFYENLSEKTYIYTLAPQVASSYKEMGFSVDYEVLEHNINGKTKYVICTNVGIDGYYCTVLQFMQLKQDYFLIVSLSAETKEEAFEVFKSIYLE